jgi:anti-anti-sigma factor
MLTVLPLEGQDGLKLRGEVDLSNSTDFAAALKAAFRPDRDLHLDLAEVSYLDLTAVGLIARTAAAFDEGHRLVLRSPPAGVRTTLAVFGWDELPGLHLIEREDT